MFYYYTHSWSYIGLSQFSLFNVRMYKITLSLYISDYWIISLHVWLRYWTHEYLTHHVSLCRVGLMVYQWCRIFMLHNRVFVMEHVCETSVSPQVFVFVLCPQKWMRPPKASDIKETWWSTTTRSCTVMCGRYMQITQNANCGQITMIRAWNQAQLLLALIVNRRSKLHTKGNHT